MNLRRALYAAAAGTLGLGIMGGAQAAGKTSTPAWIALHIDQTEVAASTSSTPALGDVVTFDTGYPSSVKNPRIELLCYQSGALVYGETASADQVKQQELTGSPGLTLGGGGSIWKDNGGAADCTANLFYFGSKAGQQTFNVIATTSFAAAG